MTAPNQPIDLEAIRARAEKALALMGEQLNGDGEYSDEIPYSTLCVIGNMEDVVAVDIPRLLAHVEALQATQLDFSLPPQGYCVTDNGNGPFWYTADEYGDDKSDYPSAVRAAWEHALLSNPPWAEIYKEWRAKHGAV